MTTTITRRRVLQTGVAAAAAHGLAAGRLAADPVVKLRILETTDLHVNVLPYDYYRDAADDTVGLARTAASSRPRARRRRTACCSTTAISSRARRWATSSPIGAA